MGFLSGIFHSRDKPTNSTNGSAYRFLFGGSNSGKTVNERSAMQMTAVYACVRILSESIAGLPVHVYKYTDTGSKEKAIKHPLYRLIHNEPNPEMTSFVFRETLMTHLLLYGNAYTQIIRNDKGEVIALYPLMANRMSVDRDDKGHGYTGSYSVVQRYMKKCRSVQTEKANLELVWGPSPAQVDFGEADFYETGRLVRKKYLTVSLPYSNDGFSQVFGGETAECVCQGRMDIFEFIGGVPPLLIFDNAAGVDRRVGDAIHESELFSRFRAHYHLRVRFCNPSSGWEKGNVERKADYNRANLFVPVPHFSDIEKYNRKLLLMHAKKAAELHYKKQIPIAELFEEDRKALLMLPSKRFNVCRYEWLKADGYGKVCMDGKHFYSTRPENANQKVLAGIRAHTVEILTEGGQVTATHKRAFGEGRTDISDYSTTLAALMKNSGAWGNSGLRRETPDALRACMDTQPKEKRKDCLRIMNELTNQYGFQAAASAMERACSRGSINICDASVLAARITGYGINTPPEAGPSLEVYDEAFLKEGGSAL